MATFIITDDPNIDWDAFNWANVTQYKYRRESSQGLPAAQDEFDRRRQAGLPAVLWRFDGGESPPALVEHCNVTLHEANRPDQGDLVEAASHNPLVREAGVAWDADRAAFIGRLRATDPDEVAEFTAILDDLLAWSKSFDWALEFVPRPPTKKQATLTFRVRGMTTPFWIAFPQSSKPTKLSVMDSDQGFPDDLRADARSRLAALDDTLTDNDQPRVTFRALADPDTRRRAFEILADLAANIAGRRGLVRPPAAPLLLRGRVTTLGNRYKDGREQMEIVVATEDRNRVPFPMNVRTPLTIQIGDIAGAGAFLYQERNKPYISQTFRNDRGITLAHALETDGFKPNDPVQLEITGSTVRVFKRMEGETHAWVPAGAPPAESVQPPPRQVVSVQRIVRDTEVVRRVKALHGCRCQVCGHVIRLPDGGVYAEGHHVHPLGGGGPDIEANVLCVCPNHHAELDLGLWDIDVERLRHVPGHDIAEQYVRHHNEVVRKGWTGILPGGDCEEIN